MLLIRNIFNLVLKQKYLESIHKYRYFGTKRWDKIIEKDLVKMDKSKDEYGSGSNRRVERITHKLDTLTPSNFIKRSLMNGTFHRSELNPFRSHEFDFALKRQSLPLKGFHFPKRSSNILDREEKLTNFAMISNLENHITNFSTEPKKTISNVVVEAKTTSEMNASNISGDLFNNDCSTKLETEVKHLIMIKIPYAFHTDMEDIKIDIENLQGKIELDFAEGIKTFVLYNENPIDENKNDCPQLSDTIKKIDVQVIEKDLGKKDTYVIPASFTDKSNKIFEKTLTEGGRENQFKEKDMISMDVHNIIDLTSSFKDFINLNKMNLNRFGFGKIHKCTANLGGSIKLVHYEGISNKHGILQNLKKELENLMTIICKKLIEYTLKNSDHNTNFSIFINLDDSNLVKKAIATDKNSKLSCIPLENKTKINVEEISNSFESVKVSNNRKKVAFYCPGSDKDKIGCTSPKMKTLKKDTKTCGFGDTGAPQKINSRNSEATKQQVPVVCINVQKDSGSKIQNSKATNLIESNTNSESNDSSSAGNMEDSLTTKNIQNEIIHEENGNEKEINSENAMAPKTPEFKIVQCPPLSVKDQLAGPNVNKENLTAIDFGCSNFSEKEYKNGKVPENKKSDDEEVSCQSLSLEKDSKIRVSENVEKSLNEKVKFKNVDCASSPQGNKMTETEGKFETKNKNNLDCGALREKNSIQSKSVQENKKQTADRLNCSVLRDMKDSGKQSQHQTSTVEGRRGKTGPSLKSPSCLAEHGQDVKLKEDINTKVASSNEDYRPIFSKFLYPTSDLATKNLAVERPGKNFDKSLSKSKSCSNEDHLGKSKNPPKVQKENLTVKFVDAMKLKYHKIPIPKINDNEVLIKIDTVGICEADIHMYETGVNSFNGELIPLGHEGSGIVEKVGKNVENLKVGDLVAIEPNVPCGRCKFCRTGRTNLCQETKYSGLMSTYVAHNADYCHKLPTNVTLEQAALLHPLALAMHACRRGGVTAGTNVLVLSASPLGICSVICSKAMGASQIIVVDMEETNLSIATKTGADHTIHITDKMDPQHISELICSKMCIYPDVIIDCCGSSQSMNLSILTINPGGIYVLVGCQEECPNVPLLAAMIKEIEFKTSFRSVNTYPTALDMVSKGKVPLSKIITHRYEFSRAKEAFDTALNEAKCKAIKVIMKFPQEKRSEIN